jgi:hypothetical protein
MEKKTFHLIAVILGIAGSLLAVLAVSVYEGYITAADAGGFSDGVLGTLSALAYVGGAGFALAERE